MTRPVYLDPNLPVCSPGHTYTLTGAEAHHAATVRRTRSGEEIDVVDGDGGRLTLQVSAVAPHEVSGVVLEYRQDTAHSPKITVVQALAKGGRDEQAVQMCTEFGADAFRPWAAMRSIVQWKGSKAIKGQERWQAIAQAAAKQSRRSYLPHVDPVMTSKELARWIADIRAQSSDTAIYVCHESACEHLTSVIDRAAEHIVLIIGPEGGISDDECALLMDSGAQCVLLGEHVLRSATAGAWACAVLRAQVR
ncbi:16S rRNA (uracil(1498)-N(3))-methyltransferase [Trueperella sp. LYQ141]|uniref:16S rRNA (uracil(1498)-N(3))-methyltransferase n=1 Tax=Trueperella sp. LYQ141 TaxID=3391058 RepID=UPI0039832EC4